MFILNGERRLNFKMVKEYKPLNDYQDQGINFYNIELTFIDGSKDKINFFENENERNKFIRMLDKKLLEL